MQGVWVWFLVEELRSHMPETNQKNHHVPPGTEHREGYSMFPMVFLPQMQDLHLNTREFQAILYWGILYQVTGLNLSKTLGPRKTRKNRKLFQTETKVTRQDNQMQSMVLDWIFFPERTWLEWLAKYKGGSRIALFQCLHWAYVRECSGLRNARWCIMWSQASCLILVLKEFKKNTNILLC